MKLRIKTVDQYGYNGRDHHPSQSDEGLVVVPLAMDSCYVTEDGDYDIAIDGGMAAYPERQDKDIERCWTCLTPDGRTLQLMEHEVEVVL